ncbi:hypothetical protein B296_00022444 [Ensete ventricosum]|uniref:Uncharacterized protein n=1 Tax=Ensete ventricosum TaxID=4639 RepID=A0A427AE57_ENSVE|nr:hypothetical protein B296_00022444 [Ensete ventricosum]
METSSISEQRPPDNAGDEEGSGADDGNGWRHTPRIAHWIARAGKLQQVLREMGRHCGKIALAAGKRRSTLSVLVRWARGGGQSVEKRSQPVEVAAATAARGRMR